MEQTKGKRSRLKSMVLVTIVLGLLGAMTEGCGGSKKCGCRHDINGVYKRR